MEGAGADLHVVGLQDHAAPVRPIALQGEDQPLERAFGAHMRRQIVGLGFMRPLLVERAGKVKPRPAQDAAMTTPAAGYVRAISWGRTVCEAGNRRAMLSAGCRVRPGRDRGRGRHRREDFPSPPDPHRGRAFPPAARPTLSAAWSPTRCRSRSASASISTTSRAPTARVGGDDVAKSEPDGYSLFLTTAGAVTVSPHIMADMPYDPLRDFAPVALVTTVTE